MDTPPIQGCRFEHRRGAARDSAKAGAHYENGVLTLTLPKKGNGSGTRKITVS